jgi:porin
VAAYGQDLDAVTKIAAPIRDFEAVFELTYQYQLAKNWTLQPDVQYIVHPGANVADPQVRTGVAPIPNAAVVGLRTILKF